MIKQIDLDAIHQFDLGDHLVLFKEGADTAQILNPLAGYIWNSTVTRMGLKVVAREIAQQLSTPPDRRGCRISKT
jgi:hypothetical protein